MLEVCSKEQVDHFTIIGTKFEDGYNLYDDIHPHLDCYTIASNRANDPLPVS